MRFRSIHTSFALAITLGLFMVVLISCDSACGNEVISLVVSPNGAYKAVAFQRDCGATTGFSTQVSIVKASKSLPNSSGNVFRADCDHGKALSGPGGGPAVQLRWLSDQDLELTYDSNARVFTKNERRSSVTIHYKTIVIQAPNP